MEWRIATALWNTPTVLREIRSAASRKLVLRLNSPSTLAFSMMGDHPESQLINELSSDAFLYLDGAALLRARCGQTQDTVGESGHGVTYSFIDYRGVLQRRKVNVADIPNVSFTSLTEQSDIVWALITAIQSRTNGSYSIARGTGTTTGIKRTWNPQPGQYVGKIIDEMSNMANGFDWDVSPQMAFNLYFPSRGFSNGVQIDFIDGAGFKAISNFTRTRNPASFANDDTVTGGQATIPVEKTSATIATDIMGRWDGVYSFPDITDQATLDERGTWVIGRSGVLIPAYSVKLVRGFWKGPAHIGLGDTIRVVIKKGRINDNQLMRVIEMPIDILDDSSEDVRLSLVGV